MAISQADAEKYILQLQDDMHKAWKAGDVKALIDYYHPDAVMVAEGQWAVYGREEITKRLEEFLKTPVDFKLSVTLTTPAADGEYIIHHGTFETAGKPPANYRQIFRKSDGGKYLIYHDLFEVN